MVDYAGVRFMIVCFHRTCDQVELHSITVANQFGILNPLCVDPEGTGSSRGSGHTPENHMRLKFSLEISVWTSLEEQLDPQLLLERGLNGVRW